MSNNLNQENSLVVDLDDTLSFTLNRDFENAIPNLKLIAKLNNLFEHGWHIHIVTARGQLSCNGDSELADKKYRAQIHSWLEKHNVWFNTLSFQKKLARYYIDDKSITPEHFLTLKFDEIGRSGARIISDSEFIYKLYPSYESAQEFIKWSENAKALIPEINIPKIVSIIGNEIKMEKIGFIEPRISDIKHILELNQKFSKISPTFIQSAKRYTNNIIDNHTAKLIAENSEILHDKCPKLFELIDDFNFYSLIFNLLEKHKSFNHGDFSIDNILVEMAGRKRRIFLIDPIFGEHKFQSYLIDLAKLYWSYFISGRKDSQHFICIIEAYIRKNIEVNFSYSFIKLVICEGLRTIKYSQTEDEKIFKLRSLETLCLQDEK